MALPVFSFRRAQAPLILLCIVILFVTAIRWRLLDVPLERDEGEYAYMAQLMLQGTPLYAEAYNMKFPGIYVAYSLILTVFGESDRGIHLGLLLSNLISIVLVYALGKSLAGTWTGLSSSAAFAMLSLSPRVQSFWANAEHFLLPFALGGFLLLLMSVRQRSLFLLALGAILFGSAAVVKQHGAFLGLSGLAFLLLTASQEKGEKRSTILTKVSIFAFAGAVPLFLSLAYVLYAGVFDRFWFWTFTYGRAYASQLEINEIPGFFLTNFRPLFQATSPIWLVASLGIGGVLLWPSMKPFRLFSLCCLVGGVAAISPGFFFRPHYFVLLLPSIALLFGLGIEFLMNLFKTLPWKTFRVGVPVVVALVSLLSPLASHADVYFEYSPFEVTRATYGGHPFPEMKSISGYLKEWTLPEDRIAIVGNEPEVFFYTQRRSATGYIYIYSLVEPQPYAVQMMDEFVHEIESTSPRVLLYTQVLPEWYKVSEKVDRLLGWYRSYADDRYRLRARYEWTPGRNTPRLISDPDSLQLRPEQIYYVNIHEARPSPGDQ